ncbi:hypothetical protein O6H91_21G004800 [Diphasiastrum complanatum]|uniref:Uncharacterized protein n=1 Tax=Diphasiastrum complanatum TaxID=34168 RepID=A0ACC2AH87_DIPCM|nr:hypothetical protein O6H91_21G004800 [Diphasiastrum complanatum]
MQCQKSRQAIRDITQAALRLNKSPLVWAIDVCTCLQELDEGKIPSIELADVLVSESLSLDGSSDILAYLNYAMVSHLVYPLHALALLTTRVIPVRHQQIEMYSAYLRLANAYLFSLASIREVTCCDRLLKAVVEALQPPYSTGKSIAEFGTNLIHFLLCLLYKLAQAIAEDWSLPSIGSDRQSKSLNAGTHNFGCHTARAHCMNVEDDMNSLRRGESERQKKKNSLKALDVVVKILQNRKTAALLRLAQRNLPEQWRMVLPKLQMLEVLAHDPLLKAPNEAMDLIKDLSDCIQHDLEQTWKSTNVPFIKVLSGGSSLIHTFLATGVATIWLPFDIFMEDAMEGRRVSVTSTAEALTELMKSLQAFYGATWHDLFLGLWTAALRLVSREREFVEGPKPHVESRLCMLLSIVPLACSIVIEEEEKNQQLSCREDIPLECNTRFEKNEDRKTSYSRRRAFKCSLQVLAQFNYLLMPPAVEAATCMSQNPKKGVHDAQVSNDVTVSKAVGNMRQLILDACIARGLLDTSAYTWPGYIGSVVSVKHTLSTQSSPWVAFMEGAPLSGTLKFALASTPAGSLAELEKAYQTAVNGLDDDRASAASILCGASLLCAWNVQEHAVRLAMQLLSPCSDSKDWAGHCLLPLAPMLLSVLKALSSNDAINVLNLHGKFPELATSLLPICEYFGTISPTVPLTASSVDISNNMLFSYAFLLLHRLWKFSQAPLGYQLLGKLLPLGSKLNLESLLELRNLKMLSSKTSLAAIDRHQTTDQVANRGIDGPRTMDPDLLSSVKGVEVVSLDSYPNLKAWYLQDQACITSALCGAAKGDDVQKLIDMMFKKINSTRNASLPTGCPNTTSSSTEDDIAGRPLLAPWDILAAIPFVVDKVITACAHGILSSRDLTTGLCQIL